MTASNKSIERALISVSDKTEILVLARYLHDKGIEILSTGGTAHYLRDHGIAVTDITAYTGFPEIMDGRVKTLHPKILGGILARRPKDENILEQHDIKPIDLVVVNLYPFAATISDPQHTHATAIENIDIGGPTMIRAAAKNYQDVAVIVDPSDYRVIVEELQQHTYLSLATRFYLAKKAFAHTAYYDGIISNYLGKIALDQSQTEIFPETLTMQFIKKQNLRYGENPHQQASFYIEKENQTANIANVVQVQGIELSFNNINDADTALECVKCFDAPACVIVKHANPCGVAIAHDCQIAYERAYQTDPVSAFGGIIAFNRPIEAALMEIILNKQFAEVIIAPEFSENAIKAANNKPKIRLLATGYWKELKPWFDIKRVQGGLLLQEADIKSLTATDLEIVTDTQPTQEQIQDLLFAWTVAKFVKSNAIVYAKNLMTIGIGAGQMSRVYSAKIAELKAKDQHLPISGSVMASDAFFPFRDSIDEAANAGVKAIIQPGGSIRDEEVIRAANVHKIAMVFTHIRHFRH